MKGQSYCPRCKERKPALCPTCQEPFPLLGVTVDIIIEYKEGIVFIQRADGQWALPGGYVEYYQTLEDAARKEAYEETGLLLADLHQMKTYGDPGRDCQNRNITIVYTATGIGENLAPTDLTENIKNIFVFTKEQIDQLDLAFDHHQVVSDYFQNFRNL